MYTWDFVVGNLKCVIGKKLGTAEHTEREREREM